MTKLIRRNDPFFNLRGELDRLFDGLSVPSGAETGNAAMWSPSVDIREDENAYVVEAELPGTSREDIHVELENNTLTLKGERKFEKKQDEENYHFIERSYGSFFRSFSLPKNVDAEKISAEYKDGMLFVTLPKREEVKPKRVDVN